MPTSRSERRKERRYVVSGMRAIVAGIECAVLDISISGVRLLSPEQPLPTQTEYELVFEIENDGGPIIHRLHGALSRSTSLYFVLSYQAPTAHWESTIRSLDFMQVFASDDIGF